ncbi:hypothetical protein OW763_13770 [Clostridium aestuarii]|uniref:Uncharacterized protein n=1 Tax=Clostridium aestuarii TaxID=338193 RepID=A0ABT4D2D0_9CLOT|nr:hypothetical protein [Clostridium aestuarii]MCY6485399.1 hypothetical protein [Clostridium aestuarii]
MNRKKLLSLTLSICILIQSLSFINVQAISTKKSLEVTGTENPDGGFCRERVYGSVVKIVTIGSDKFSTKTEVILPVTIMRYKTPAGVFQEFEKIFDKDAYCTIIGGSYDEITSSKLRISNTRNKVVIDGDIYLKQGYDKSFTYIEYLPKQL